jgi:hypothetical protein
MKRHIMRMFLISCLLVTTLFCSSAVFAQDDELPDPGITPDSPFYFLDKLGKNISMFFTFGEEAKANKALRYAEERLAEVQAMAEKNKIREMTRAANDYEGFMEMVNERLEAAMENGTSANVSERLSELAYRIHTRLSELKDRLLPAFSENISINDGKNNEEAREIIDRAKMAIINSQIKALRLLAKNKTERALNISQETIEKLTERARARFSDNVTDNVSGDVNEDLDYAARIAELEDEMVQIAEEKGIDVTAIQQRLAQSTSNRLEVLTRVYENAPEAARQGIENAIENSVEKYEKVVQKLREKTALGEITENTTTLQDIPEKIREKLHLQISNAAQIRTEAENQKQNREQLSNSETGASENQTGEQKFSQARVRDRTGS